MSVNKRTLLNWLNQDLSRLKKRCETEANNIAIIKNLKKGDILYCSSFKVPEGKYRRTGLLVDLLAERGISLIDTRTNEDFYVPWIYFTYHPWRTK